MGEQFQGAGEGGDLEGAEEAGERSGRERGATIAASSPCAGRARGRAPKEPDRDRRSRDRRCRRACATDLRARDRRRATQSATPCRRAVARATRRRVARREAGDAPRHPGVAGRAALARAARHRDEQPLGRVTQVRRERLTGDLAIDVERRLPVQLEDPVALDARRNGDQIGDRATALADGDASRRVQREDQPARAAAHGAIGRGEQGLARRRRAPRRPPRRRGRRSASAAASRVASSRADRRIRRRGRSRWPIGPSRASTSGPIASSTPVGPATWNAVHRRRRGPSTATDGPRLLLHSPVAHRMASGARDLPGTERFAGGRAGAFDVEVAADREEQRGLGLRGPGRSESRPPRRATPR